MTAFAGSGLEHIVRENEPLGPYTWFRLGGTAQYFAEPTSVDELAALVRYAAKESIPLRILGAGSRVLVPDQGVDGLVVQLTAPAFCEIRVEGHEVHAGGGVKLGHLVATSVREGLAGLENLVGIPGTVAGALRGNADSNGSAIGQWTSSATVMTRQADIVTKQRDELRFSYGESNLDELAILSASFHLEPGDSAELTRRMQKCWIVKQTTQPASHLGIGRIFKDPQGVSAATLIEETGLRGHRIGHAQISESNANYIEVSPGTTSANVRQLVELMETRVSESLGVDLECELEIW
jgi:UDP-N-acetylmuramate dehydrogenase